MPNNIQYSEQHILNKLAGNTALTGKGERDVFNTANSSANLTLQEILNVNKSSVSRTAKSAQQVLYEILKTPLSLTGPMSQYSDQYLLNAAFNAAIPILTVVGK